MSLKEALVKQCGEQKEEIIGIGRCMEVFFYQDSAEGFTRAYGVFRETEFLTVADLSLCLCCYCSPSMTGYFRSHRFVSRLIFPSLGYRSVPCSSRTAVPKVLFLGIPGICI